jgi:hypothetical protein
MILDSLCFSVSDSSSTTVADPCPVSETAGSVSRLASLPRALNFTATRSHLCFSVVLSRVFQRVDRVLWCGPPTCTACRPTGSKRFPPRTRHRGREELARSCRCRGGVPSRALSDGVPPRSGCLAEPAINSTGSPATGHAACHATRCPVPPGALCLLFLRSSSIEPLVLVSAPPVRRAVAWAWLAELAFLL